MIRSHLFHAGKIETFDGPSTLSRPAAGNHVWVEAIGPDRTESAALVALLGVHELAMEDALAEGHPPKLEEFEDHLFMIAHTPYGAHQTRKLAIFLGKSWILTVERTEISMLDNVTKRVEKEPARFLANPERLAHALLDYMSDGFEHRTEELLDKAEAMEDASLENPEPATMAAILDLRREVVALSRIVRAQRDVFVALIRTAHPALSKKMQPYLRDIYDHALRVSDLLDGVRDQIYAARDAHLANSNVKLQEVMKTLTVITILVAPFTLLSSIWGMNFSEIPGSRHRFGFYIACAAMAGLALVMYRWFRKKGWF